MKASGPRLQKERPRGGRRTREHSRRADPGKCAGSKGGLSLAGTRTAPIHYHCRVRFLVLLALACPVPASAQTADEALHRTFQQAQGGRYTILFSGPEDYALASRAIEVLNDAYDRIASALLTFPPRTITVVLYSQQQFQDVTRAPAWAAGAYDGTIRLPVRGALERPEELARVLSHELAHAIIQSIAARGVPVWLGEGLAVMFEPEGTARLEAELARLPRRLPFERLARSFQSLSAEEARIAYAQSAAIARTLFDEVGGPTLVTILRDLAAGQTFEAAYERRLGLPFAQFADRFGPDH